MPTRDTTVIAESSKAVRAIGRASMLTRKPKAESADCIGNCTLSRDRADVAAPRLAHQDRTERVKTLCKAWWQQAKMRATLKEEVLAVTRQ